MKRLLVFLFLLLRLTTAHSQYPIPIKLAGDTISIQTISDWMQAAGEVTPSQAPYSVALLNQQSHLPVKTAPFSLSDWYGYGTVVTPVPFTTCGAPFVVAHTAGTVAPVTKTVSYGTVATALTGSGKCWITQNLGADQQATSAIDATEASGGWYWQFNRPQGYKMDNDGVTRTPATLWNATISETSDWAPANDPCALLLGSGWRIPTNTEWSTANTIGVWNSLSDEYASVLKLHAAGFFYNSGMFSYRGTWGDYWSSTQADVSNGRDQNFSSGNSGPNTFLKSYGFSLRCLNDFTGCGGPMVLTHTAGSIAPVTKTVTYGTVTSGLTGTSKCWITQNLGADHQATSATDATDSSSGWYWQFNRPQGYKNDGAILTPGWTITGITETGDWVSSSDPCTLLLGRGWRIPTYSEWNNVNTNGAWTNYGSVFSSVLKLHAAGWLGNSSGTMNVKGSGGDYWSSTQSDISNGWYMGFNSTLATGMYIAPKAYGFALRCLKDLPVPFTTCGSAFVVSHTAGIVAPVNKIVTYGTVISGLSGASKCWITQNLGADHQASSPTDATEASAGWYWQFNRMQGYKMADDGVTRTPASTWITSFNEPSDWVAPNDPCTLSLGAGWRIPTNTEWSNATVAGGWLTGNATATYTSALKLHAAGNLVYSNGGLTNRGAYGYYWSSMHGSATYGWFLFFNTNANMSSDNKANGWSVRCLQDLTPSAYIGCGSPFVVTHTAGIVAPVTKTVSYGTVATGLSGASKCWITQNLGADQQALSVGDTTEASAGWYWQFNRIQGYKMANDGITRTPATTWITSISESSDWVPASDPCTVLLGTGWRIPTNSEWTNSNTNGGWSPGLQIAYNSNLKLHAAGHILNGALLARGSGSNYWTNTQYSSTSGWHLGATTTYSQMSSYDKSYGFSIRCLQDIAPLAFTTCGNPFVVTHTAGTVAPVTKTVSYGTVLSGLSGASKCWITQNLGADQQAGSVTDATEASAGWYWQFNKPQGFKHDGTTRTPSTTWITSISESSDWVSASDPCTQLLGAGWRIPTSSEWTNTTGGWSGSSATAYASVLKLHTSGYLDLTGALSSRGVQSWFWSGTQSSVVLGAGVYTGNIGMYPDNKVYAFAIRCLQDPVITPFTTCGNTFVVTHTAGTIAPVNKTVTYGTAMSSLSGAPKCWITQNLGADNQAISATDSSESAAGWYWQFNKSQGYKLASDGTRTPSSAWITGISESSDWLPANDPCTQLLGTGWRIPTYSEWNNANTIGGWSSGYMTSIYASSLKLNGPGYLYINNGSVTNRGSYGYYWSNMQVDVANGWCLYFNSGSSKLGSGGKADGFSIRCLQDPVAIPFTFCGSPFIVTHTAGINGAPVTKTVSYGTVVTNLSGTNKCWLTQNLGADNQANSATDTREMAAGWYWQFNRSQGYKMADDGLTRTPTTTWIISITETSDWLSANDPCTLLLGTNWRLPTYSEWNNANTSGSWKSYTDDYASVLKLHTAGFLGNGGSGGLQARGTQGDYWSSTQVSSTIAWDMAFNTNSYLSPDYKPYGFSVRCLQDFPVAFTTCGNNFVVTHTVGTVAPVSKTVTYGTVSSTLSGASKCWITQNLGADRQATSATDATEASSGWYWQFNKPQGYKMADDGVTRTPASAWITPISETSDWVPGNDPCTLLLGTGWRLPTQTEWTNTNTAWGNAGYPTGYTSALKLHATGYLYASSGMYSRSSLGYYWSSTQNSALSGWCLNFFSGNSNMFNNDKADGFTVRCLQDPAPAPFTTCGSSFVVTHTVGTVAPVTKTVTYGTVMTSLSGANKCWITQNLGATNQAASATDATEASAGWYWQFNRMQGYKMADDGVTRTPATTWITSISETSDWLAANDPCALSLGSGWRIPTYSEWINVYNVLVLSPTPNYNGAYTSLLKLHASGYLVNSDGTLLTRGSKGYFNSSTQSSTVNSWFYDFDSGGMGVSSNSKTYSWSVRCLNDPTPVPFTTCGNNFVVTHTAGTIAPITKTVSYGTISTNLSGASKCWITQNLGADRQASSATDATEMSSGWYFQFNRPQGYKMSDDGTNTRTPAATWITTISESSDWTATNDPCALSLGTGWRIPTYSEWTTTNTAGGWSTGFAAAAYASVLKLHAAGFLNTTGALTNRGVGGNYWSGTQASLTNGSDLWFNSSNSYLTTDYKTIGFPVRCLNDPTPIPFTTCGNTFIVAHTAGTVAPVSKTVSYGTVASSLSGASECWLTQNLGADRQATSATDATEASAGWYWQFNRSQGYKNDGTILTPAWTITAISESSNWVAANDPCTLLLGGGWRMPTNTEWTSANIAGGWTSYTTNYASVLKLHAAGMLNSSTGGLQVRSASGSYWSSTQNDVTTGFSFGFDNGSSYTNTNNKATGYSARCLQDMAPLAFTTCGNAFVVTHTGGTVAPVTKTVTYGTVTSSLSGASKCWITQNLGADRQATSATDATEASAGWYWQFNRTQGYKVADDNTTRTPSTTWDATNDALYPGWDPAKDPCTLLLGSGWRLPTYTEWTSANTIGGWTNYSTIYTSILKLHAAGYIDNITYLLTNRGSTGIYWGSTQNNATTGWGMYFISSSSSLASGYKAAGYSARCLKDFVPVAFTTCGNAFVVTHTAGIIAPVTKTVSYGTVMSNLSGSNKCWITQNLGSDQQATSGSDGSEASAGWYWQFNKVQGYKHDGTTRTPASAWITPISENSDWVAANDPCTQLLGSGWRIPTQGEWASASGSSGWSGWTNDTTIYASVLKIHAAGYLLNTDGSLWYRVTTGPNSTGTYWSSTQASVTQSWRLHFYSTSRDIQALDKSYGLSIRCLKDPDPKPFTTCGNTFVVAHNAGLVAPVSKTVSYGTVMSSLSGAPKCWITQNLGADHQAVSATDATEASAGWYWQFNRPQGYKMADDGVTRTPATTWTTVISETGDWAPANDPCTLLLGSGWRIPTYSEYTNVYTNAAWINYMDAYASALKLHAGGDLEINGSLLDRGIVGRFRSSTQSDATNVFHLGVKVENCYLTTGTKSGGWTLRCLKDYPVPFTTCGNAFVVTHTAGTVAPVTKTVTYGTVVSNLSGLPKCWITQNLGADHQASSYTDITEASSGWYWQFNRTQGYKAADDGITRTPATPWITSINETGDWLPARDPCNLLLGSGWRMPTYLEWYNTFQINGWTTSFAAGAYASALKIHRSGYLEPTQGFLTARGVNIDYWSSTQYDVTLGYWLFSINTAGYVGQYPKPHGFTTRCLRDSLVPFTSCGNSFVVTHIASTIAPVTKTVTYGTVTSTLSGAGKCWIIQNLGADHQANSATDATEGSAGWYWQFNKTQGYKMADDKFTRTPATTWINSITESSDWVAANDPCTELLGTGWRIPTNSEWTNAITAGGWTTGYGATYASELKLHTSGYLTTSMGTLSDRGNYGYFWSSTQFSNSNCGYIAFSSTISNMVNNNKAYGFPVRCLKD